MTRKYSEQREAGSYFFGLGVISGSLVTALLATYLDLLLASIIGIGGGLSVLIVMKLKDRRRKGKEKYRRNQR